MAEDKEEEEDKEQREPSPSMFGVPAPMKIDAKHIASYAALIAALVGVANSYLAYRKAKEESVARESYKTTTLAIERLSDESHLNHEEIVSLRTYLLDHIASGNVAAQLDPPPPVPPIIENRNAPIVVSRGRGTPAPSPQSTWDHSGPSNVLPSFPAASGTIRVIPPTREPTRMPSEWPEDP